MGQDTLTARAGARLGATCQILRVPTSSGEPQAARTAGGRSRTRLQPTVPEEELWDFKQSLWSLPLPPPANVEWSAQRVKS